MAQKHLQLLRNNNAYTSYTAALTALRTWDFTTKPLSDGTPVIARYTETDNDGSLHQRTLLGVVNGTSMDIINNVSDYLLRNYAEFTGDNTAIAAADDVKTAIAKLEKHIADVAADITVTVEEAQDANTQAHLDITATTSTTEGDTYTIGLKDVASESALTAEITARKTVDGQTGQTYAANANANYISGVDSLNAADVALDTAVASLSGKVDNLDFTLAKDDNKVVVSLSQTDGQVDATSELITSVKLSGYAEGTDADIAATDTLGQALGKLQAQINAMDKAASAVDGQVVTTVTEVDGKVTETKANVKDLQLGGYSKTADSGAISGTDTVNVALSKLENNIAAAQSATTVASADKSINVTTAATGTDINVNIKSGEHVLAKGGNAGLYTDIKLSGVTPSLTTVKEEYSLVATDGTVLGDSIKIYKDSSLVSMELVSGGTAEAPTQILRYTYIDASGATQTTDVDVSMLLAENEFKSGVTVTAAGIVTGVVDTNSEKVITSYNENGTSASTGSVLTVGESGFSVANIQAAIDAKVGTLDYTDTAVAGQYVSEVDETDGKIAVSRANVSDAVLKGYSKGSKPASTAIAATDDVKGAIAKLEHQIDDAKAAATTKVEKDAAASHLTLTSSTAADGSVTYTIGESDIASKTDLDAEIAARKAVDGQTGQTYTANGSANYISTATSLNDADVKLDTALKALNDETIKTITSTNTGCTVTVSGSGNTRNIAVNTDGGQVQLTGYEATGATGAPAATDSVNAAIAKLYNRGTITSTNSGITVDQSGSATTLTLNVSTDTAEAGTTGATYAQKEDGNAIELRDNGIFVSSNWDCGTY